MTHIPHILSPDTLTVLVDGDPKSIPADTHNIAEFRAIMDAPVFDQARLDRLVDPARGIAEYLDGSGVQLIGSTVVYRGKRIVGVLEDKLLSIAAEGLPLDPWKKFVARVYDNPNDFSREELFLFLEGSDLPITEDGCFLAWKRVSADYKDLHTRSIDNSVGQVVSMPRHEVDADRARTCSTGLHFCSKGYLKHFGYAGDKIVIVKVDPADVVSIPNDYDNTKGRTWKYEVVGEVATEDEAAKKEWGIVDTTYLSQRSFDDVADELPEYEYEDDDVWPEDSADELEDFDPEVQVNTQAFVAPQLDKPKRGFWHKLLGR